MKDETFRNIAIISIIIAIIYALTKTIKIDKNIIMLIITLIIIVALFKLQDI